MTIDRDEPLFSRNIEMDASFLKVVRHELASGKVAGCAPVTDSPGVITLYELAKQFQQILSIGHSLKLAAQKVVPDYLLTYLPCLAPKPRLYMQKKISNQREIPIGQLKVSKRKRMSVRLHPSISVVG